MADGHRIFFKIDYPRSEHVDAFARPSRSLCPPNGVITIMLAEEY